MILERKNRLNLEYPVLEFEKLGFSPEPMLNQFMAFAHMQQVYSGAMQEVSTKLEILDEEFQVKNDHNPIHYMQCRLKSPQSIVEKLQRKHMEISVESAMKNLHDIAGIRVVCHYIQDIYSIAEKILRQDDIILIKKTDYIKNPKKNGYRSLHMVLSIPVFLSEETKHVPVEIQIRTIAMDFWASLEHQIRYKSNIEVQQDLQGELFDCAQNIAMIDEKMQNIFRKIMRKNPSKE